MTELNQSVKNNIAQLVESLLIEQYGKIYDENNEYELKEEYKAKFELYYKEITKSITTTLSVLKIFY